MQRSFAALVRLDNNTSSLLRVRISLGLNNEPSKPHSSTQDSYFYILAYIDWKIN